MVRAFVLTYSLLLLGCGYGASNKALLVETPNNTNADTTSSAIPQPESACKIEVSTLRAFYASVPDKFRDVEKDTIFFRQLENCPRDEVIAKLEQIRQSIPDDYAMRFKVTYLFIKLHYDKEKNRKALLDIFNSYPYEKSERVNIEPDRAMDMVADCIVQGEFDDLIPHVLDLKTDNAVATIYYGSLTTLLKRAPERFMKSLSKRSERERYDLYSSLCIATPKPELAEALSNVNMSSDLYPVFVEMRTFFSRDPRCSRFQGQ